MKTETLLLIVAVGAVAYFAFRRPAQAQPTVVVQSAPPPQQGAGGGFLQGVGRLLDQGIDYFTSDDQEEDVELLFFD